MENAITLPEAIKAMREDTRRGVPFEITWVSFSIANGKSEGVKHIRRCLLRANPPVSVDRYVNEKLCLFDIDTKDNRSCWQVLIKEYNGKNVRLL